MSKQPTPKADQLRAMRESRYTSAVWPSEGIPALKEKIAAVPVKKAQKKPKEKRS